MTTVNGSEKFYGTIPVFRGFSRLMDPALYSPLPGDWSIGVADIVESTKAIGNSILSCGRSFNDLTMV